MEEPNAVKKYYSFTIISTILGVIIFWIILRLTDDLYKTIWIFIPLLIIFGIISWKLGQPVRKEIKKSGKAKEMYLASMKAINMKMYVPLGYFIGITWIIIGSMLLWMELFTRLSGSSTLLIIGALSFASGVLALFSARALSKGKEWGFTVLFVLLLLSFLFVALLPFILG